MSVSSGRYKSCKGICVEEIEGSPQVFDDRKLQISGSDSSSRKTIKPKQNKLWKLFKNMMLILINIQTLFYLLFYEYLYFSFLVRIQTGTMSHVTDDPVKSLVQIYVD